MQPNEYPKYLGKQSIRLVFTKDGEELCSIRGRRAVYEDREGKFWVLHPSGKKQIHWDGNVFTWRFPIPVVQNNPILEAFALLKK